MGLEMIDSSMRKSTENGGVVIKIVEILRHVVLAPRLSRDLVF